MRFMLLVYVDENSWSQGEWSQCTVESMALCDQLASKGQLVDASPLHPVATAVCVRVREGQPLVTKGPFAETSEQLGGFFIVDVRDLDEAISIAAELPPAKKGTIEIRQVVDAQGIPAAQFDRAKGTTPVYMLLCYDDERYWQQAPAKVQEAGMNAAIKLANDLDLRGEYVSAAPLAPTSTATHVRIRHGKRHVMTGPFAETREVLGGYYLVSQKDVGDAIAIAMKHPGAHVGSVEIRPIYQRHNRPAPNACEIVTYRDFPFSAETIFSAFANPERLARWWGPESDSASFQTFDFRPDGEWKLMTRDQKGTVDLQYYRFVAIRPSELLVLDRRSSPEFRLTISLNELMPHVTTMSWRTEFSTLQRRSESAESLSHDTQRSLDRLERELRTFNH